MSVTTRSPADALAALVGPAAITADPHRLLDGVRPRWWVVPATTEEVAAVVAFAHDTTLTVCPVGSNSTFELGRPIERVDIALDLGRLDAILEYNPEDLTVSVQAGVPLAALRTLVREHRLIFPVDPPGAGSRTLGGLAVTHAHGPLRLKYRSIRDLLLGVRFVQADGVITWGGARVVKSVTGYDVPKLMVGSLGTLGLLTELTLRLQPRPETETTWIATFTAVEAAAAFLARLLDSTVQPSRVEFVDAAAQRLSGLPGSPASIAVSIGSVEEAVRAQGTTVAAYVGASGGTLFEASTTFWEAYEAATLPARCSMSLTLTAPPSRLDRVVAMVDAAGRAARAAVTLTGSAALGLFRVGVEGVDADAGARLVRELRAAAAEHGGSVVIERGPRAVRTLVDPWGPVEPGAFALMRALKDEFDPRGILNGGRFVGGI